MFAAKEGAGRAGRSDHNIAAITRVVQAAELDGLAIELLSQANSAVVSAVGYEDRLGAMGQQVTRGQFTHLSRTHQKNVLALQRSKDLLRKLHCYGCHRN